MQIAALYDVHGNLPALEAVLADPRCAATDLVVSGGDVVAGPMPAECVDRLEAEGDRVRYLMGNGDRETVWTTTDDPGFAESLRWSANRLGEERLARIAAWPATVELGVAGLGTVLFCHGTPSSDTAILAPATPDTDVAAVLAGVEAEVVVCGHTHVQFDREAAGKRLVNAGSVGMPYEARPGAYWALLGPEVALRRTGYDLEAAAAAIRVSGFPEAGELADENVLKVPTAEEATEQFERMAQALDEAG